MSDTTLFSNKDLKKIIFPLVVEQFLAILVGFADTLMIAGSGEAAVSGVSLVDNISILFIGLFSALATGGAVVAGHFLGKKDPEGAGQAAWQLVLFSFWFSAIISIIFMLWRGPILSTIFGKIDADVMSSAQTYLLITAGSMCPLAVYNACAALFRSMQDSKTTMLISLFMNVMNVCGNALLIYGFGMGVAGAAISTLLSRTAAAVIIYTMMFNKTKTINLAGRVTWKPDFYLMKKILFIGIPNGIENSLFQLGKILLLSLVSTLGTASIAANAVAGTFCSFNCIPGNALNMTIVSVVAVCIGAKDYKQARHYTIKLCLWSLLFTGILSVILFFGMPYFVSFYGISEEAVRLTIQIVRLHATFAVISWIWSFSLPNTLRAAGDVVFTMTTAVLSMWIFRILCAYLFVKVFQMGVMGVWLAMMVDWCVRAVVYVIRYRGHRWERREIV